MVAKEMYPEQTTVNHKQYSELLFYSFSGAKPLVFSIFSFAYESATRPFSMKGYAISGIQPTRPNIAWLFGFTTPIISVSIRRSYQVKSVSPIFELAWSICLTLWLDLPVCSHWHHILVASNMEAFCLASAGGLTKTQTHALFKKNFRKPGICTQSTARVPILNIFDLCFVDLGYFSIVN